MGHQGFLDEKTKCTVNILSFFKRKKKGKMVRRTKKNIGSFLEIISNIFSTNNCDSFPCKSVKHTAKEKITNNHIFSHVVSTQIKSCLIQWLCFLIWKQKQQNISLLLHIKVDLLFNTHSYWKWGLRAWVINMNTWKINSIFFDNE